MSLDLFQSLQSQIIKILTNIKLPKILYLDNITKQSVSSVLPHSKAIDCKVYLFKNLQNLSQITPSSRFMASIFILIPTENNIKKLCSILDDDILSNCYLYFYGEPSRNQISKLAECDKKNNVVQIDILWLNYCPLDTSLFISTLSPSDFLKGENDSSNGLFGVIQTLKMNPFVRYSHHSNESKRMSESLLERIENYSARPSGSDLVLVLDRKFDVITPLLTQWTYLPMIHELAGIRNQSVKVQNDSYEGILNLCDREDSFLQKNKFSIFSECSSRAKTALQQFKRETNDFKDDSIEGMSRMLEKMTVTAQKSDFLALHFNLLTQISKEVKKRNLMEISQLEQELAVSTNMKSTAALESIKSLIDREIASCDLTRLVLLFAMHFQTEKPQINKIKAILEENGNFETILALKGLERYSVGIQQERSYIGQHILEKTFNVMQEAIKGVDNVYSRHVPSLAMILDKAIKGKLDKTHFPFAGTESVGSTKGERKIKRVVVYIVGGCTYQEAMLVQKVNEEYKVRVVLGGPYVLNSGLFVEKLSSEYK